MTPNFTTIFRDNGYELAMGGENMWAQERHSRDLVTVTSYSRFHSSKHFSKWYKRVCLQAILLYFVQSC